MTIGLLFIGHGTRRQAGIDEFLSFVSAVRSRLSRSIPCAHAFLELQKPDIASGVDELIRQGVTFVVCVPFFLFAAGHMKEDIPSELATVQNKYPHLSFSLLPPFGEATALVDVALARLQEQGVEDLGHTTAVVLVGRGNKDEEAQRANQGVAQAISARLQGGLVEVGYLAGTGESLENVLTRLRADGWGQIMLLPYLWFQGWLTDTLPDRVEAWRDNADIEIHIASHLGLHPLFLDLVTQRVSSALVQLCNPVVSE